MKKALKIIGIVVLVLVVLFFGAKIWLGHKIKNTIESKVTEMTQGLVHMDVGRVKLRLIGRSVELKDIRITSEQVETDSVRLPFKQINGQIERIKLSGIHYQNKDSLMKISARKLAIDIDSLAVGMAEANRQSSNPKQSAQSERIQLQLDKIDIFAGQIGCKMTQPKDTVSYDLKDLRFKLMDGRFDTAKEAGKAPFSCSDVRLSFDKFQNLFAAKTQLLEVDSLDIRGEDGIISVGKVNLLPLYSKAEFALKAPGHTDWTKIQATGVYCTRFDLQKLLQDGILKIDSVSIGGAEISSYKNRKIDQKKKVKRLFYQSVQELGVPVAIGRIELNHINVEYQEMSKNGLTPGTITFNDLNGVFSGLTNIVNPEQPYYTLQAQGKLLDQAKIHATFRLPVDSLNQHFEVEGGLAAMPMTALNPMIEPLVKVQITSGEITELKFKIEGNSMKSKTDMLFLYGGLKIRVMKEKDGELKTASFITTLANGLIAKENNPDHRGIRRAVGVAERDIYRSQFNYLWRSLLSGLKISIGLG